MNQGRLKKRWISTLLFLAILITSVTYQPVRAKAEVETKEKKYLVLMQSEIDWYVGYDDLIVVDDKGNPMIKAYEASKAAGIIYKKESNTTFSITNDYTGYNDYRFDMKSALFRKGRSVYKYKEGDFSIEAYMRVPAYTTAKTDSSSAANVIHYQAFGELTNHAFYFGADTKEYGKLGYDGVFVYSKRSKIDTLPQVDKIIDKNGDYMFPAPGSKRIEDVKSIIIGGVQVPIVDGFKDPKTCDPGSFGDDNMETHLYYDAMMYKFCPYINKAMKATGYDIIYGSTPILYLDDFIRICPTADFNRPAMFLKKNGDQYELTLFILFKGKYKTIYENCLKLCLAGFTSDVDKTFDALMDSFMGDETLGINKNTWTKVGKLKIKYAIVNKHAVYYFKAA